MLVLPVLIAAATLWQPTMPPQRVGPGPMDKYLLWRGDYGREPKVPAPLVIEDVDPFAPKSAAPKDKLRLEPRLGGEPRRGRDLRKPRG